MIDAKNVSPYETEPWEVDLPGKEANYYWWAHGWRDGQFFFSVTNGKKVLGTGPTASAALEAAGLV